MIWLQFAGTALVIVLAGARLARYGDVLGEKSGLGRSWIGVVLLAATTSLPELFTGFGATALAPLPNIALGDVLGSCMFNLLILSMMDAVQPEPLSARAHQGHAISIGFGLLLIGVAGVGLVVGDRVPTLGWVGVPSSRAGAVGGVAWPLGSAGVAFLRRPRPGSRSAGSSSDGSVLSSSDWPMGPSVPEMPVRSRPVAPAGPVQRHEPARFPWSGPSAPGTTPNP